MSESATVTQGRKKALMFPVGPFRKQQRYCDVPVESSSLCDQREAMKRKAVELDAGIVGKFVIPKQSNWVTNPLFRHMLHVISPQGIDYVLIYPDRPHRIYQRSAVIATAINRAGTQVVSSQNMHNVTVPPEHLHEISV